MRNKLAIYISLGLSTILLILIYFYKNFKSFNIFDILVNWLDIKSLPLYFYFKNYYIAFFKFHFFVFVFIVLCACFFIIRYIYIEGIKEYNPKIFNKIPNDQSISHFIYTVLKKHPIEFLLLFSIILTISVIIIRESFSNHHNYLSVVVGFALSIFSILFGMLGMYFAYMAENKSNELLDDRSSFFYNFKSFMEKINQELSDEDTPTRPKKYDLYTENDLEKLDEEEKEKKITSFYCFKLVMLTPFLGHAGITLSTESNKTSTKKDEILDEHEKYMNNILKLSTYYNCCVQITIPPLNEIFEWYGIIQFLNNLKNAKLISKKSIREQIQKEATKKRLLEDTSNYLYTIGNEYDIKAKNGKEFSSFLKYIEEWESKTFSNISISLREDIPFQGLIVTKYKSKNHITKFHSEKIIKKLNNGIKPMIGTSNLLEDNQVAYISFVGSSTFKNVNNNLTNPDSKNHAMGLNELFTNLHSTFKSVDPRMLEIFNNHYKQLWNVQKAKNYPKFNFVNSGTEEYLFNNTWSDEKCKTYIDNLIKMFCDE